TQEFSQFKSDADRDGEKSAKVVIVDGAQGGKDAADWVARRSSDAIWEMALHRIESAGVTPAQVQVIWVKQALKGPAMHEEFPKHAKDLEGNLVSIVEM